MFQHTQCLLFFAKGQKRRSGRRPPPTVSGARLYALLPSAFAEQHPEVVAIFQEYNIHIVRNGDEDRVFAEIFELDVLEFFLDEGPNLINGTLLVVSDQPDSRNLLPRIFYRATVEVAVVAQVKWIGSDARPAVDDQNCQVFERLLQYRCALEEDQDEGRLLHLAASRDMDVLVHTLLDHGAEINVRTEREMTPLHVAVAKGAVRTVQLLIARGACIEAKSRSGRTPLHEACYNNHLQIMECLRKSNVYFYWKAIHPNMTPLHKAVRNSGDDTVAIVRLLLKAGAAVNAKALEGESALFYSVSSPQVLKVLLENGGDANCKVSKHGLLIHWAVKTSSVASIEMLLNYGARVDATFEEKSVLHLVYQKLPPEPELFKFLLEFCFVNPGIQGEIQMVQFVGDILQSVSPYNCWKRPIGEYCDILSLFLVKFTALHDVPPLVFNVELIWSEESEPLASFRQKCAVEVAQMKGHKLGTTDVSVRDFLACNECQVSRLLQNPAVLGAVNPDALTKQFPIYGTILVHHVRKGKHRKWLQEEGIRCLSSLSARIKQLPDEVKEAILDRLAIIDIMNVKRASELLAP